MNLQQYKEKRNFEKTPEPKSGGARKKQLRFVVQEHHASRLHYDLRLEMEGVLRSWAVPKGPSLDPSVSRLAIHVEDHPLSYIDFYGTIPKGNYGAGKVFIWDTGTYKVHGNSVSQNKTAIDAYHEGKILFNIHGKKLKGRYALVKTNGKNWLLKKTADQYSHKNKKNEKFKFTKDPFPHDISPMLATLGEKPFDNKEWSFEIKWDGYRAIAEVDTDLKLYSRKGNSFNKQYPQIIQALKKIKQQLIFDGEIVALDDNGNLSFQELQLAAEKKPTLRYYLFDLLYINGKDIRSLPYEKRRELLELFTFKPPLFLSKRIQKNGIKFFKKIKNKNFEGIIAKKNSSSYQTGKRTADWLKIKTDTRQEAIICGYTVPRGGRKYFGALILGVMENNTLQYIGHTGSGFNDALLKDVYIKLQKIKTNKVPFLKKPKTNELPVWVKPVLVCEVKFSEWTKEGYMRHPIFLGLRPDKNPKEVIREFSKKSMQKKIIKKEKQKENYFTNTEKIFFPKERITKGDVLLYYQKMAPYIMPYVRHRPQVMFRQPNGISKKGFFQKDTSGMTMPSFVRTVDIISETDNKKSRYIVCDNINTLLFIINLGCIELNSFSSTVKDLGSPDYSIIDIDAKQSDFKTALAASKVIYEILKKISADVFIKTSGKTGLHILVPLKQGYTFEQSRQFAELICLLAHKKMPNDTTVERVPKKRGQKIYLDFLQNRIHQTITAPYSLRPVEGATVSTPLEFSELGKKIAPQNFNIKTIEKRMQKKKNIWKNFFKKRNNLFKLIKNIKKLGK